MTETAPAANIHEYTVSELSFALKRTIEDAYGLVRVRGEIGRVSRPGSGHIYLDLKDEKSVLAAVIWRGQTGRLKITPEQGLEVICTGKLTTFPGQSRYQIVIEQMEPAGIGALMALLEARRKKLAAEGLFDEAHKKPLPYLPDIIGVVTSPTGAVIRDILHRLSDRFPRRVLIWPVVVQGDKAADQIAEAIRGFNRLSATGKVPRPDLLIVARGGGSVEDLWAFNEENVVRASFESEIPLISAVGHETDTTLIDLVADRRAPTPSAAAEMAVPVRADLVAKVLDLEARTGTAFDRLIRERRSQIDGLARGLPKRDDLLALPGQRLDGVADRLRGALRYHVQQQTTRLSQVARLSDRPLRLAVDRHRRRSIELMDRSSRALTNRVKRAQDRLTAQIRLLDSLSYSGVLERGFVLVRDATGRLVRRAADTSAGQAIALQFADDQRAAVIEGGRGRRGKRPSAPSKPANRAKKSDPNSQGSLF